MNFTKKHLFAFAILLMAVGCKNKATKESKIDSKVESTSQHVCNDKTLFSKSLNLQGVDFIIVSTSNHGKNKLSITTTGLPHDYNESFDIGTENVVNAEVEDLNSDGSPELVVFTQKDEPQKRANVYAFSVNNKKSMSQVYFQPTEENKKINNGYNGHDEFALVETYLVQRFSLYKDGVKTDKTRQIQYVLVDGEASRKFKVKNQSEY